MLVFGGVKMGYSLLTRWLPHDSSCVFRRGYNHKAIHWRSGEENGYLGKSDVGGKNCSRMFFPYLSTYLYVCLFVYVYIDKHIYIDIYTYINILWNVIFSEPRWSLMDGDISYSTKGYGLKLLKPPEWIYRCTNSSLLGMINLPVALSPQVWVIVQMRYVPCCKSIEGQC